MTLPVFVYVRKPKLLQLKKTDVHLRDLSAAQLATVLSGLISSITPLQLFKIGGEVLQVGMPSIMSLPFHLRVYLHAHLHPFACLILQIRKSITFQWKQQTAGARGELDMHKKLDMVSREGSAERVWKTRLLQILQTGWMCFSMPS